MEPGRMETAPGFSWCPEREGAFSACKSLFRILLQAAARIFRSAVSGLLFTEAMATSEVVLGKLISSCSISQEVDRVGDLNFIDTATESPLDFVPLSQIAPLV
jgi:hypothetical protein